jgi:sugar phosphate isomerase/epimerase
MGSWAFSFGPFADNPIPFDKIARRLAEAEYDGIEVSGFPPHVTLEAYPTTESRRWLARFLKELDLSVSCYSADLTAVNPAARENRQRYLDLFQQNLELCVDIGSPAIRVDPGAAPGSIPDDEYALTFDHIAGVWRSAAEIAGQAGVRVLWEFEPGFVFNKPSEVMAMHEKVGHPNFRILFDTCHAYMCGVIGARQHPPKERLRGGVPEFVRLLKGRIGHIHIIDSDGTLHGDETSTHCPFGEGNIDFRSLAPQLLDIANVDWWCIDLCFWAGAWDLIDSSREFVLSLLGSKAAA